MIGDEVNGSASSPIFVRRADLFVPIGVASLALAVDMAMVHLLRMRSWTLVLVGIALGFAVLGRRPALAALRDGLLLLCLLSVPLVALFGERLPLPMRVAFNTPAMVAVVLLVTAVFHRNGIGAGLLDRRWRESLPGLREAVGVLGNSVLAGFLFGLVEKEAQVGTEIPKWLFLLPALYLLGHLLPKRWTILRRSALAGGSLGLVIAFFGALTGRWPWELFFLFVVLATLASAHEGRSRLTAKHLVPERAPKVGSSGEGDSDGKAAETTPLSSGTRSESGSVG